MRVGGAGLMRVGGAGLMRVGWAGSMRMGWAELVSWMGRAHEWDGAADLVPAVPSDREVALADAPRKARRDLLDALLALRRQLRLGGG